MRPIPAGMKDYQHVLYLINKVMRVFHIKNIGRYHRGRNQRIIPFFMVLILAFSIPLAEFSHTDLDHSHECETCAHLSTNFDHFDIDVNWFPNAVNPIRFIYRFESNFMAYSKPLRIIIRGPPQ